LKRKLLLLISFYILLAGCHNDESIDIITFTASEDYNVVFIPKTTTDDLNKTYMDALIELKAKYPLEFKEINKTEKKTEELNLSNELAGPSLTIFKNGQVVERMSGDPHKEEIKEKLELTVGND
jgi:thiol-disulfide isomerase/thioredoxin